MNCANNGNTVTTKFVYSNTSSLNCSSNAAKNNWIAPPPGYTLITTNGYTPDPLVGTPEVLSQTSRLTAVAAIASPSLAFSGFTRGLVFVADGNLVASMAQEGLLRLRTPMTEQRT